MMSLATGRLMVTLVASLLAAGAALADVSVSLEADDKADTVRPFRAARVTIEPGDIPDQAAVRAVLLQPEGGGPTILIPAVLVPGSPTQLVAPLPATSVEQTYRIGLLDADDADAVIVAESRASITWPVESVTPEAFLATEAYRKWEFDLPAWPAGTVRNVFLAAVLVGLATAGLLLVPPGALRAVALGLIVVAACWAMWSVLHSADIVVETTDADGTITVLTCRRTTVWHSDDAGWSPLYFDASQMKSQVVLIRPGRGMSVRLSPSQVQLIARAPT